jgi:hypothetical protein
MSNCLFFNHLIKFTARFCIKNSAFKEFLAISSLETIRSKMAQHMLYHTIYEQHMNNSHKHECKSTQLKTIIGAEVS